MRCSLCLLAVDTYSYQNCVKQHYYRYSCGMKINAALLHHHYAHRILRPNQRCQSGNSNRMLHTTNIKMKVLQLINKSAIKSYSPQGHDFKESHALAEYGRLCFIFELARRGDHSTYFEKSLDPRLQYFQFTNWSAKCLPGAPDYCTYMIKGYAQIDNRGEVGRQKQWTRTVETACKVADAAIDCPSRTKFYM